MLLEQSIVFSKKKLPACISQQLGIIPCLPKGYKPRQFLKKEFATNNTFKCSLQDNIWLPELKNLALSKLDFIISDTHFGFIKGG